MIKNAQTALAADGTRDVLTFVPTGASPSAPALRFNRAGDVAYLPDRPGRLPECVVVRCPNVSQQMIIQIADRAPPARPVNPVRDHSKDAGSGSHNEPVSVPLIWSSLLRDT